MNPKAFRVVGRVFDERRRPAMPLEPRMGVAAHESAGVGRVTWPAYCSNSDWPAPPA